jgi:hypothetical protein
MTGWYADLTIYSLDTKASTSYHDLEQDGGIRLLGGIWSPDGRELWYEHASSGNPGSGNTLKALDLVSGRVRELFTLPQRGIMSLSADGRMMVFLQPDSDGESAEIVVAKTGQTDGRVIATIRDPDRVRPATAPPLISPQGDKVLYVVERPTNTGQRMGTLWVVESNGTNARALVTGPRIMSARWDPSGRFIAYTPREEDSGNTALRVIDLASGAEHDIPVPGGHARVHLQDWSRDGRYIGFIKAEFWWEYWAVQGLLNGEQ